MAPNALRERNGQTWRALGSGSASAGGFPAITAGGAAKNLYFSLPFSTFLYFIAACAEPYPVKWALPGG